MNLEIPNETYLKYKNEFAFRCDNCNHVFDNDEEYFVVHEGEVGESNLCGDCSVIYRYGKENVGKYVYKEN